MRPLPERVVVRVPFLAPVALPDVEADVEADVVAGFLAEPFGVGGFFAAGAAAFGARPVLVRVPDVGRAVLRDPAEEARPPGRAPPLGAAGRRLDGMVRLCRPALDAVRSADGAPSIDTACSPLQGDQLPRSTDARQADGLPGVLGGVPPVASVTQGHAVQRGKAARPA